MDYLPVVTLQLDHIDFLTGKQVKPINICEHLLQKQQEHLQEQKIHIYPLSTKGWHPEEVVTEQLWQ